MHIISFFFSTGLATVLVLLAWGDNFKKPSEYVINLENAFIKFLKLKKKELLPLLRNGFSFIEQMSSIMDISKNEKVKAGDLNIIDEIKEIHNLRDKIEKKNKCKYYLVVILAIFSFVSGIISYLVGKIVVYKIITINKILIFLFLIQITKIIYNLIRLYIIEENFTNLIHLTKDKVED